jgi:hypothetical protein
LLLLSSSSWSRCPFSLPAADNESSLVGNVSLFIIYSTGTLFVYIRSKFIF